ncbi:hypothetical protein [Streptomyces misionensis]|uniref:hypothetical protein n=1 Tax=Streptomyces misionensis TaxID=67331 RepID=UPI003679A0CA
MPDEQPEHVWYRGSQLQDGTYALVCVTNYYHWGAVPADVAATFPDWTENLFLQSLDVIDPEHAAEIRAAAEAGDQIQWQLP